MPFQFSLLQLFVVTAFIGSLISLTDAAARCDMPQLRNMPLMPHEREMQRPPKERTCELTVVILGVVAVMSGTGTLVLSIPARAEHDDVGI